MAKDLLKSDIKLWLCNYAEKHTHQLFIRMLEVCYSPFEDIDIHGLPNEIEDFRQRILGFLKTDTEKLQVETNKTVDPNQYELVAEGLEIVRKGEAVRVSVSDDKIVKIEGSKENLEKFSSFLEFEENAVTGRHSHYEHYDGNEWIASDSMPLIIGIK